MELTEGKFNMCGWGFLASSFVEQPLLQYMAIASLICIVISHNPSLIFFLMHLLLEVRAISEDGALIEGINVVPSISLAAHKGMTWMISDMASPTLIETESLLTIMTERGCLFLCKHTVGITRTIYTTL